jgi:hypothetical protein
LLCFFLNFSRYRMAVRRLEVWTLLPSTLAVPL